MVVTILPKRRITGLAICFLRTRDPRPVRAGVHGLITAHLGWGHTTGLTTTVVRRRKRHTVRGDVRRLKALERDLEHRFGDCVIVTRRRRAA